MSKTGVTSWSVRQAVTRSSATTHAVRAQVTGIGAAAWRVLVDEAPSSGTPGHGAPAVRLTKPLQMPTGQPAALRPSVTPTVHHLSGGVHVR
jgi:uncharacterized protein with LGFP repeats